MAQQGAFFAPQGGGGRGGRGGGRGGWRGGGRGGNAGGRGGAPPTPHPDKEACIREIDQYQRAVDIAFNNVRKEVAARNNDPNLVKYTVPFEEFLGCAWPSLQRSHRCSAGNAAAGKSGQTGPRKWVGCNKYGHYVTREQFMEMLKAAINRETKLRPVELTDPPCAFSLIHPEECMRGDCTYDHLGTTFDVGYKGPVFTFSSKPNGEEIMRFLRLKTGQGCSLAECFLELTTGQPQNPGSAPPSRNIEPSQPEAVWPAVLGFAIPDIATHNVDPELVSWSCAEWVEQIAPLLHPLDDIKMMSYFGQGVLLAKRCVIDVRSRQLSKEAEQKAGQIAEEGEGKGEGEVEGEGEGKGGEEEEEEEWGNPEELWEAMRGDVEDAFRQLFHDIAALPQVKMQDPGAVEATVAAGLATAQ